jgi:ribonuclease P protein component
MLVSKNRLRKKSDIDNVFKKGKTVTGNFIFLRAAKNNLDINRFAFVVSSKISKKSVTRNKIKRQLREIIKKNILKIKQGFDFVLIVRPQIVNQGFKEIEKEIDAIFNSKFNKII